MGWIVPVPCEFFGQVSVCIVYSLNVNHLNGLMVQECSLCFVHINDILYSELYKGIDRGRTSCRRPL